MSAAGRFYAVEPHYRLAFCGVCCAVIVDDPEGANRAQHLAEMHAEEVHAARKNAS